MREPPIISTFVAVTQVGSNSRKHVPAVFAISETPGPRTGFRRMNGTPCIRGERLIPRVRRTQGQAQSGFPQRRQDTDEEPFQALPPVSEIRVRSYRIYILLLTYQTSCLR